MMHKMKRYVSEDEKFYDIIYRLKFLIRYSNIPRNHNESVAEHSFFVCAILMNLHTKYEFDLGWALKMSIAHDMPEAYTNDISWETKENFPEIRDILHKIEMKLAEKFPTAVGQGIRDFLGDSVEAQFVKYADIIQCHQYSSIEIENGGARYMYGVKTSAESRMREFAKELKAYERTT